MKIQLNLTLTDPEVLLARLREGFRLARQSLEIEILGPGIIVHDTALLLFDEIQKRPVGLRLHANARSCLFDGAILLWLAADTREIRSDAWIQFTSLPPGSAPMVFLGKAPHLGPALSAEAETPAGTDLRSIAAHLARWLPVHEIAGLRIFPLDLADFGLIPDPSGQLEFQNLFDFPILYENSESDDLHGGALFKINKPTGISPRRQRG